MKLDFLLNEFKLKCKSKAINPSDFHAKLEQRLPQYKGRWQRSMTDQIKNLPDFESLIAKNLKLQTNLDIKLTELPKYFDFFLLLAGSEVYNTRNDNQADRDAAYKMAQLYDNLVHANENIYNSKENIHELNIEIGFAYHSFKWTNNAKGNAGVTVIIVGLRNVSNEPKYLIFPDNIRYQPKNINPYLMGAPNIVVYGRSRPVSKFPEMNFGNMPNDGGGLIITLEQKNNLISDYPDASKFVKILLGSSEFIRGNKRYCLWIEDEDLEEAESIPFIRERIDLARIHRINSKDKGTNGLTKKSHQFRDRNIAKNSQIIIPRVSSERREYIPCDDINKDIIISDSALAIYDAEPFMFAIIHSRMHMVWVKAVGGKLKTDYRYSKDICYNTFPFPDISVKQKENLNLYVYAILDERAKYPEKTMAQLYNPDTMPKGLKQAHEELDEAIEKCYRLQPFKSDTERLEFLFKLYEEMIKKNTLFAKQKKTRKKK
ncbi:MAG: type IIL restriction-modification enzyme MmeI [Bacteroidota bacterium]